MTVLFQGDVVCPIFIGRQPDLTALQLLVDRQKSGQGKIALLCGEAGIGKSRLVSEVRTYATANKVLALQGNCFQTDRLVPYAPLLDLFGSYFTHHAISEVGDTRNPLLSVLSTLLPELTFLFPDLAEAPALPSADPEQEKRQLFAAMTHFFLEQSARQPVLLIIEDIHWCDDVSLEFLLRLARRCQKAPLLILITFRSDEVQPSLRQWLAQMDRERLTREFMLHRLSYSEIAAMLQAILHMERVADAELLDTLSDLSEGNPFFIEELLKSLITTGDLTYVDGKWMRTSHKTLIPRSIQETVQQRMRYLSTDAKRLLTLAAIAGRRFNVTLLQQVMECDEERLLMLLKEVMAAQLVVEEASDQFAFRHALTQQAISSEMLVREREGIHRSIAESLERLSTSTHSPERYLEDLAYHCYEAGMWEKAMAYSQEVGEKALKLYAQKAAIEHLTHAIHAAQYLSQLPPAHLYLKRGQAHDTLGDFEHARRDYERALEAARTAGQNTMEWQSMLALGFLWTGRDYKRAGEWFYKALAYAEQLEDTQLLARSLNRLGNWLANTGNAGEGVESHQKALHLFEAMQDSQGMVETFDLLGMAIFFAGDTDKAVQYLGEAAARFRRYGDQQSLLSSLTARAIHSAPEVLETTISALRTRDECLQDIAEALQLAHQTHTLTDLAFTELVNAQALLSFGDLGPGLDQAKEALRLAISIDHQQWIAAASVALGQGYLLLLEPSQAISTLASGLETARSLGSGYWVSYLTSCLVQSYLLQGDTIRAEAALKAISPWNHVPRTTPERRISWTWGELALAQNKPQMALELADQLLASAPGERRDQPIPHLLKLRGEALVRLARFDEAVQAFEDAKRGARERQAPSILWRVHCALGHLHHRLKREELAQRECSAARQIIETLAGTIDETDLREHFFRAATSLLLPEKTNSSRAATRSKYDGLSIREREVAALVAQGKTNREIASQLVVSERTAEAHVSNMLGKLGFTTRAQIVAWAIEKGLNRP